MIKKVNAMNKQEKVNLISLIMIVGFTIAVFYYYIMGRYFHVGYPFNTFLFIPDDRFNDFYNHFKVSSNPYGQSVYRGVYFPIFYIVLGLFSKLPKEIFLSIVMGLFIIYLVVYSIYHLRNESKVITLQNAFIFVFLSYPVLLLIDRGNFEAVSFISLSLFVFLYPKYPRISLLFLIFPIGAKVIPGLFLLLPLADKRYKDVILTCIIIVCLTIVCYALLPGGLIINLINHVVNLRVQDQTYLLINHDHALGISFFGLIKYFAVWIFQSHSEGLISEKILKFYVPLSAILGIIFACYVYFSKMPFWQRVALIVCAVNLLPTISMDYKLISLFIPLYLFICDKGKNKTNSYYAILFALLLIPKQYYLPFYSYNSISVVVNTGFMVLMVVRIVVDNIKNVGFPKIINGDTTKIGDLLKRNQNFHKSVQSDIITSPRNL